MVANKSMKSKTKRAVKSSKKEKQSKKAGTQTRKHTKSAKKGKKGKKGKGKRPPTEWMLHIKKTQSENPNLIFKEVLVMAGKTYKK